MNKAISTAVAGTLKSADVNALIATALKDYLKTADLKQANYDAGFHSDWFGTEAQYSSTSHDANVNYHTKEEG